MYRSDSDGAQSSVPAALLADERLATRVDQKRLAVRIKRAMDILGALTFFIFLLPLFVTIAVCVRISSHGPAIYSQSRVGLKGRIFRFYKFRSMAHNSDEVLSSFLDSDRDARFQWDTYQKLDRDPRVTPFGRFIRKTSIDELPQFWNVLVGDMSLVGPRPCVPEQEGRYGKYWSAYCSMRPGLTGLWQVSGRNNLSYADRVRLDARYAREWSLWLDIKILFRTVKVVLTAHGSQ
jgi:lipopolysaccharide/colanic/teichoic acid biosynthesis glycosyltransferase